MNIIIIGESIRADVGQLAYEGHHSLSQLETAPRYYLVIESFELKPKAQNNLDFASGYGFNSQVSKTS